MSKIAKRLAVSLALGLTTIAFASNAEAAPRKHHHGYARAVPQQPGYAREYPQRNQAEENAWMDYVSRPSPGL
jgi:hypothetical protein